VKLRLFGRFSTLVESPDEIAPLRPFATPVFVIVPICPAGIKTGFAGNVLPLTANPKRVPLVKVNPPLPTLAPWARTIAPELSAMVPV
jgi:hypothetical protein